MNKGDFIVWFSLALLIIGFLFMGLYFAFYYDDKEGVSFCERMGYDATNWLFGDDGYSEYFGKIKCYASFDGEYVYKTFNVTRKFGRFFEEELGE